MPIQSSDKCNWLSYEQFCEYVSMPRYSFNYMCREGNVKARKFGRFWYVHRSVIE